MTLRPKRVWVVEMWGFSTKWTEDWGPTVGTALTRDDARRALADWKRRNPTDRFRLTCYATTRRGDRAEKGRVRHG